MRISRLRIEWKHFYRILSIKFCLEQSIIEAFFGFFCFSNCVQTLSIWPVSHQIFVVWSSLFCWYFCKIIYPSKMRGYIVEISEKGPSVKLFSLIVAFCKDISKCEKFWDPKTLIYQHILKERGLILCETDFSTKKLFFCPQNGKHLLFQLKAR